jgi:hypothetical protein
VTDGADTQRLALEADFRDQLQVSLFGYTPRDSFLRIPYLETGA